MIRYYTNRDLSSRFKINLAKWKRWSREFLPPDPLGGLQSGYARQYTRDDAFAVYLGGHLVSDLRFTIPETKRILSDLSNWLGKSGFYKNAGIESDGLDDVKKKIDAYLIYVRSGSDLCGNLNGFTYAVRGVISNKTLTVKGHTVEQEQYLEYIPCPPGNSEPPDRSGTPDHLNVTRIINITDLFRRFYCFLEETRKSAL
jgi:hypothetical protein